MKRVSKAMILAAGFGLRMRPITQHIPKPIVPIANISLLTLHLQCLASIGIRQVIVNLHHKAELIKKEIGDGQKWSLEILYSIETPSILGTGGGLARVNSLLRDEDCFLLLNSDVLSGVNLLELIDLHCSSGAAATMVVREHPGSSQFSSIGVDADGYVKQVPDMPESDTLDRRLFIGVQVLTPKIFEHLPTNGYSCLIRNGYRAMIEANIPVRGFVDKSSQWEEIGTPTALLDANIRALAAHEPVEPGPSLINEGVINQPVLIGENVVIGKDATVGPFAVIGDNCRVAPGAKVQFCVALAGANLLKDTDYYRCVAFNEEIVHCTT